jgi:hypothetical protein
VGIPGRAGGRRGLSGTPQRAAAPRLSRCMQPVPRRPPPGLAPVAYWPMARLHMSALPPVREPARAHRPRPPSYTMTPRQRLCKAAGRRLPRLAAICQFREPANRRRLMNSLANLPPLRLSRASARPVPLTYISALEAQLGYALTAVIVLALALTVAGAMHVRAETRPMPRPSRVVVRKVVRRVPRVTPGDLCVCGGTVGRISGQPGDLLGCTGCNRSWTTDGRKIVRR